MCFESGVDYAHASRCHDFLFWPAVVLCCVALRCVVLFVPDAHGREARQRWPARAEPTPGRRPALLPPRVPPFCSILGMSSFRYNEGGSGAPATAPAPPPFTRSGTSYQQRFPQPAFAAPSLSTEGIQTVSDFLLSLPHPRYWPTLLLTTLVLDPIRTLISNVILLVTSPRTHRVVLRLSVLASLFWAALALAILASIGFYRAWVPDVGRVEEVHLQYGHADGRVPFAVIDLKRSRAVGAPAADGDWFAEEQEYDVSLDLLIPISSANLDLGACTAWDSGFLFIAHHSLAATRPAQATSWSPSTSSQTTIAPSSTPPAQLSFVQVRPRYASSRNSQPTCHPDMPVHPRSLSPSHPLHSSS